MADKYLVKVNQFMSIEKDIPRYFVGIIERQTAKAYKIVGQGILLKNKLGICSICSRELTNPNSIKLGIGPICAQNMGINILSGFTDKDIEKELHKIKIDSWFPKSCVELNDDLKGLNIPDIPLPTLSVKQPKKVEIHGDIVKIFFPYNKDVLFKVKAIAGRRFKKTDNPHWTCPNIIQNLLDLEKIGFNIPWPEDKKEGQSKTENKDKVRLPNHLKSVLMPFQKEGVQFILEKHGRALIGDEMGLGKTIQALTYMEMKSKICIIVCPASLKLNWASEINKWCTNYNLWICEGKKNRKEIQIVSNSLANKDIYIVNWDILGNKTETKGTGTKKKTIDIPYTGQVDYLLDKNPDLVIADEIHFAKNPTTGRSRGVTRMGKRVKDFIGLSGTPIENRPKEFFSTLNLINASLFSSWWNYVTRYCGAVRGKFGLEYNGATNIEELHQIVGNVMIRRKKDEVLKELPPKIRTVIPMGIDNRKTYQHAESNLIQYLKETKGKKAAEKAGNAEELVKIEKLKQLCWEGKKKACIKWITDYLETENKLVIFGVHKDTLNYIQNHFGDICVKIDGSVQANKRQDIVNDFQNNSKVRLFLGNIKAAGVGLTLTAANATCFLEFPWTPGATDQAEDRVHRIGQTADSVTAYYLVAEKTIDEKSIEMLDEKRKVVDGVLDGKKAKSVSLTKLLLNS